MSDRTVRKLTGGGAEESLLERIRALNERGEKRVIRTRARNAVITAEFVGHMLAVHNGREFTPVYVIAPMVGHRLGEFAPVGFRTIQRSTLVGTVSRQQVREAVKAVMRQRVDLGVPASWPVSEAPAPHPAI
jgi:small subunit ribosomal protein S19